RSSTSSIGTTESAPSGTTPPVAIAIASPASSARPAGLPAAIRSATGSVAGTSPDRIAKPSIAEAGNGGRSPADDAGSASTRPEASSTATSSAGNGRTRSSTSASASLIVSRPFTGADDNRTGRSADAVLLGQRGRMVRGGDVRRDDLGGRRGRRRRV